MFTKIQELIDELKKLNEHLKDIKIMIAPVLGYKIKNEK